MEVSDGADEQLVDDDMQVFNLHAQKSLGSLCNMTWCVPSYLANFDSMRDKRWDDDEMKSMEQLKRDGDDVYYHVSEVYSPKRVNSSAEKLNLIPGMSLDLSTVCLLYTSPRPRD